MIKTYCAEYEKDWDEGISLLLFAARESVQETLGYSPFELVFGREVRGPLKGDGWVMTLKLVCWNMCPSSKIDCKKPQKLPDKI